MTIFKRFRKRTKQDDTAKTSQKKDITSPADDVSSSDTGSSDPRGTLRGGLSFADLNISLETLGVDIENDRVPATQQQDVHHPTSLETDTGAAAEATSASRRGTMAMPENETMMMDEAAKKRLYAFLENRPKPRETLVDEMPLVEQLKQSRETLVDEMPLAEQLKHQRETLVDETPPVEQLKHQRETLVDETPPVKQLKHKGVLAKAENDQPSPRETVVKVQPTVVSSTVVDVVPDVTETKLTRVDSPFPAPLPAPDIAPLEPLPDEIPLEPEEAGPLIDAIGDNGITATVADAEFSTETVLPALSEEAPDVEATEATEALDGAGHLEQIVELFSRYLCDPTTLKWRDWATLDDDLSARLAALSDEKEEILGALMVALVTEDSKRVGGMMYAFMSLFGEMAVPQVTARLSAAEDDITSTFAAAMSVVDAPGVTRAVLSLVTHERPAVRRAAVSIIARRGELSDAQAAELLDADLDLTDAALVSDLLGLLPPDQQASLWEKIHHSGDDSTKQAGAVEVLKAHHPGCVTYLTDAVRNRVNLSPEMLDNLALCGGNDAWLLLSRCMDIIGLEVHILRLLGRLGDPAAMETLLHGLESDDENIRMAARDALQQLTGARVVDEETKQLSTSRRLWQRWWEANKAAFDSGCRYRNGAPVSFETCIDIIADENSENLERWRAYLTLAIRAGVSIPFRIDWPARKQHAAIAALRAWWQENSASFVAGAWYFGGKLLDADM